jgi:hypothetical protein
VRVFQAAVVTGLRKIRVVEVLLADPESLGNDALETDIYLLRDQLTSDRRVLADGACHSGSGVFGGGEGLADLGG